MDVFSGYKREPIFYCNLDYLFVLLVNPIWTNDRNKNNPNLSNPIKCLWKPIFSLSKLSTFSIKTQSISFSISFWFDWIWHPKTQNFMLALFTWMGRDFFGQKSRMTLNRTLHSNKIHFLAFSKFQKIYKLYQKLRE